MNRALGVIIGAAWAVAVSAPADALAGTWEEDVAASNRSLNQHVFIPSPYVTSPFTTTHLASLTQYAYAEATGPTFDVAGLTLGGRTYKQAAFGSEIEYQLRFADLVAVRVSGDAIVFSGIDGPSVLVTGASFRYTFNAGFTLGHQFGPAVRLALVMDASFRPALDLTIASGVLRALQARAFDAGGVLVIGKTVTLRPGLSVAWSPHRLVGLQGEVRYTYTKVVQSSDENATANAVDLAAAVDVDLAPVTPVAIGFNGFYRLLSPVEGSSQFKIEAAGGGVFYTGRPQFLAGVSVTQQAFHIRPELVTKATIVDLQLRYYW